MLASELGINPQNDGKVIRLIFPQLTEERRKELTKQVKKYGEGGKVAIRNIRRDAMEKFKAMKKKSELTEDDLKELEEAMQKLTDKRCKEIDDLTAKKEAETHGRVRWAMAFWHRKETAMRPGRSLILTRLPRHIGIIMDGNGRWAKKRGLPRTAGHAAGAETFRTIAYRCQGPGDSLPHRLRLLHRELETSGGGGFRYHGPAAQVPAGGPGEDGEGRVPHPVFRGPGGPAPGAAHPLPGDGGDRRGGGGGQVSDQRLPELRRTG